MIRRKRPQPLPDQCPTCHAAPRHWKRIPGMKEEYEDRGHWLIVGAHTKEVIGCTDSRLDVLREEPEATFRLVDPAKCSVCLESGA